MVFAVAILFAYCYGRFLVEPLISWTDNTESISPPLALIIISLPTIILAQTGSYLIYGKMKKGSIALGAALYFGWLFMDFYEPPFAILKDGAYNIGALGWKGTSDTVIAWMLQTFFGVSGPDIFTYTFAYGAIVYLVIAVLLGGLSIVNNLFSNSMSD